jgi:hypothetical protein
MQLCEMVLQGVHLDVIIHECRIGWLKPSMAAPWQPHGLTENSLDDSHFAYDAPRKGTVDLVPNCTVSVSGCLGRGLLFPWTQHGA